MVISGIDSSLYMKRQKWMERQNGSVSENYASTFKANSRCSIFTFSRQYAEGNLNMIIGLTNLNPALLSTTDLIDVYVYRSGVRNGEMAFASAISLYQSVFGLILVVISNKIAGKVDPESTLF